MTAIPTEPPQPREVNAVLEDGWRRKPSLLGLVALLIFRRIAT
jgi:hypothetical protein